MSSARFLYSTNPFLKLLIQERYQEDRHFVWCSPAFDAERLAAYGSSSSLPPSSNPAEIYRQLSAEVRAGDLHSAKIEQQRASYLKRAVEWHKAGKVTEQDRADIAYMAKKSPIGMWRPLLYVIDRSAVADRLHAVAANKCANPAVPEFIVRNLARTEFDILEWRQ